MAGGIGGVLAGCLGEGNAPAQPTHSPTQSPPVETRVEVPACPDRPASLTYDSVVRYAIQFEKAYTTRVILQENDRVTYVQFKQLAGMYDGEPNAEISRVDDGWVVRFSVTPAYGYRPHEGTAESVHVDPAQYTANYFISATTVYRQKIGDGTPGDPRQTGTVVHCPPK